MNILDIPMQKNDANAKTIREYLFRLMDKLWSEQEIFSGKRPFGNSGWEFELYTALINFDSSYGSLDEDGYIVDFDNKKCYDTIQNAIRDLFFEKGNKNEI